MRLGMSISERQRGETPMDKIATKTHILVSGYYGFGNAGDELILLSVLNSLRGLRNNLRIAVLSGDPKSTNEEYKVKAINRLNIFSFFSELYKTDLLISGGGGLLQDITSFWSPLYYLGIIFLAQTFGKKTFLYAQGIGPLKSRLIHWLAGTILNHMTKLTVRDEESKNFICRLGINHFRVQTTADPVFSLELPTLAKESIERKRFGFVFRKISPEEQKIWAEAIDQIHQNLDTEIILIPFQEREDYPIAKKIAQLMKNEAKLFQWKNLNQLVTLFSSLDLVVAMRLHALILGLINQKIVIGISDEPKIVNLLGAFDLPVISQITSSPENLSKSIVHIWQEREKYQKTIRGKVPFYRKEAKRTAQLALELL